MRVELEPVLSFPMRELRMRPAGDWGGRDRVTKGGILETGNTIAGIFCVLELQGFLYEVFCPNP